MSLALLVLTLSVLTSGLWGGAGVEPEAEAIAQTEGHVGPNLKVIGGSGESSEQVLPEQALQNIRTILQERDRLRVMRDKIKHEQALALEAAAGVNDDEDRQLISKGYEVQLKANTRRIEAVENSLVRKDLSTAIKKLQGDYDNAFKAGNIEGARDFQADLNALQDIAAKRNERARVGVAKDKILGAGSKDLEAAKQELATFSEETEELNKAYRDATDDSVKEDLLNKINSRTGRKLDLEQALEDQQIVYNQQRKLIEQEHKEIEKSKKAVARQKKDHADLSRDIVNIDAELAELNSAEAKARFSQMDNDLERLNKIKRLEDDKERKLKTLKNVEELSDPVKTKESIKRALKLLAGSRTELTKEEEQSFKRLKKAGNKLAGPDKSEFVRLEAIQRRGEELKKLRQNPAVNMAYLQAYSGKRIGVVKRIEDGISALDPNADDYAEGRKSLENARRHAALGKNLSPEDVKGLISPSSASVASAASTARNIPSTPVKGPDNSSPASSESTEASVPSVKPNASPVLSKKTPEEWMNATSAELKAEVARQVAKRNSQILEAQKIDERFDKEVESLEKMTGLTSERRNELKRKIEAERAKELSKKDSSGQRIARRDEKVSFNPFEFKARLVEMRNKFADSERLDSGSETVVAARKEAAANYYSEGGEYATSEDNLNTEAGLRVRGREAGLRVRGKIEEMQFQDLMGRYRKRKSWLKGGGVDLSDNPSLAELKKRRESDLNRSRGVLDFLKRKDKKTVVEERREAEIKERLLQRVKNNPDLLERAKKNSLVSEKLRRDSLSRRQRLMEGVVGAKQRVGKMAIAGKDGIKSWWEGSTMRSVVKFAKSPIASTRKIIAEKKAKREQEKDEQERVGRERGHAMASDVNSRVNELRDKKPPPPVGSGDMPSPRKLNRRNSRGARL